MPAGLPCLGRLPCRRRRAAFVFSFVGAATVTWLPKEVVRPLVLVLMVAVVVYTLIKPDFGKLQGARLAGRAGAAAMRWRWELYSVFMMDSSVRGRAAS